MPALLRWMRTNLNLHKNCKKHQNQKARIGRVEGNQALSVYSQTGNWVSGGGCSHACAGKSVSILWNGLLMLVMLLKLQGWIWTVVTYRLMSKERSQPWFYLQNVRLWWNNQNCLKDLKNPQLTKLDIGTSHRPKGGFYVCRIAKPWYWDNCRAICRSVNTQQGIEWQAQYFAGCLPLSKLEESAKGSWFNKLAPSVCHERWAWRDNI